ncbi:MAG: ATP-binding protein [Saprospiraceae bacterium]
MNTTKRLKSRTDELIYKKMVRKMIRIASNPNNIMEVENYLRDLSSAYKISEDRYPDILISLTEAVNNAIIHGNHSDEKNSRPNRVYRNQQEHHNQSQRRR